MATDIIVFVKNGNVVLPAQQPCRTQTRNTGTYNCYFHFRIMQQAGLPVYGPIITKS
jgi:hypothetical protein